MRKIGSKILIGVFAVLYIGFFLVTGISDLTNKEDLHSVNVDMAYEALEVEHSINGLIPVGKDHYYIGLDTDTMEYYVIHASKKWLGENFDDSAQSLESGGLNITALSKELDYKIAREMSSVSQRLGDAVFPYGASNCLEVSYKSDAVLKLVTLALTILVALAAFCYSKRPVKGIGGKILVAVLAAVCILNLMVLI